MNVAWHIVLQKFLKYILQKKKYLSANKFLLCKLYIQQISTNINNL